MGEHKTNPTVIAERAGRGAREVMKAMLFEDVRIGSIRLEEHGCPTMCVVVARGPLADKVHEMMQEWAKQLNEVDPEADPMCEPELDFEAGEDEQ